MLFFLFFIHCLLGRHIQIEPENTLTFYEEVENDQLFKFIYDSRNRVKVVLTDPRGKLITVSNGYSGVFHTKIHCEDSKLLRIDVTNESKYPSKFSFKIPNVDTEVPGFLGYVGETDFVGELTRILDQVVVRQNEFVESTKLNQQAIVASRKIIRVFVFVELVLTGIAVYAMHKDFIGMFEKKATL